MKKKIFVTFVCFMAIMAQTFELRGEELRLSIYHYPPFVIDAKEDARISGIDVDVVKEIAKRMNLEVIFSKCPWVRCLRQMEEGTIDILTNAGKNPEREKYMLYCDKPFLTDFPIVFYFKKGRGHLVKAYEDLYKFTIGCERGAVYFDQFDKDKKLRKHPLPSYEQLFQMVNSGRIDGVIGYKYTLDYIISELGFQGAFEETPYSPGSYAESFITMSKRSPLASRFSDFNKVHGQLLEEGVVERIKKAYFTKYSSENPKK